MKGILYFVIMILVMLACQRDKNPLSIDDTNDGARHLQIQTDSTFYHWQSNDHSYNATINGTLTNLTESLYYAQVGDLMGSWDQWQHAYFAENSGTKLEWFNPDTHNWQEIHIMGYLIEGTRSRPLAPLTQYPFTSSMLRFKSSTNADNLITGTFRFKLEYYLMEDSTDIDTLYDYSNVFDIRLDIDT